MKHTARCSAIGPISQNAVPKKAYIYYIGLEGMSEILKGGKKQWQ